MSAEITPERLAEIEARAAKVVEVFGDNWPIEYDRDFNEAVCRFEDEDAPFTNVFIEVFRTSQWPDGEETSPVAEFLAASIVDVPALLGEMERLRAELDAIRVRAHARSEELLAARDARPFDDRVRRRAFELAAHEVRRIVQPAAPGEAETAGGAE